MIDADHSNDAGAAVESTDSVSPTDADDAVARAESLARQARARATRLRQQAQADISGTAGNDSGAEVRPAHGRRTRLRRPRPPTRATVGTVAAILLIVASLVAGGYMTRQHMSLQRRHRHIDEVVAAARRGIEMMMSIDPVHAQDNIMALVDNTDGELQTQLRATSTMLVADAQKAGVTTKATVQDVAVESMADDSAVALVVAKSDTTDADSSKRPPVYWRISVDLIRTDGRLKMSKVDFIQ